MHPNDAVKGEECTIIEAEGNNICVPMMWLRENIIDGG